ncbi:UNVERIFIED_CONTAM: hypothetical protein NCL1_51277 [Trichonephila clavipes]
MADLHSNSQTLMDVENKAREYLCSEYGILIVITSLHGILRHIGNILSSAICDPDIEFSNEKKEANVSLYYATKLGFAGKFDRSRACVTSPNPIIAVSSVKCRDFHIKNE